MTESDEERMALLNALHSVHSTSLCAYGAGEQEDVEFTLEDKDDVLIGKPFSHVLKVRSTCPDYLITTKYMCQFL